MPVALRGANPITHILVRSPNWIGDQILAFPFFYFLRKSYPLARITVACVPWVKDLQFKGLVDDVYSLDLKGSDSFLDRLGQLDRHARQIRKMGPWDLSIALPNSISSAWVLFRSEARIRRGYSLDGRGLLLTEKLNWATAESLHRSQAYLNLLPLAGIPVVPATEFWGLPPETVGDSALPGELFTFDAETYWPEAAALEPPGEPYWVLAPGATAETRRWSLDQFQKLAEKIYLETGWTGVIVGGPAEAPFGDQLMSRSGLKLKNWTAKGPVTGLWKIFKNSRFTVCNESGLAHVASLCGSSVYIVCGAADPRRTKPIGPGRTHVIFNAVECWPCEKNRCYQPPLTFLQCLKGISAETVWAEIQRGLIQLRPQENDIQ